MSPLLPFDSAQQNAHDIVEKNFLLSLAVSAFPYPLVSGMALKALQLKMVYELSLVYRQRFSENLGRSVFLIIAAGLVASSAMGLFGRFVPRATPLGFATNILAQVIAGGGETYAIGHVMRLHFESGGSLQNFDIKASRKHLVDLYVEGKTAASKAVEHKIKPNRGGK